MKIKSANGTKCMLLYSPFNGSNGGYFIRVKQPEGGFIDYDILHCDLSLTIEDEDAFFYEFDDGRKYLDHSPETLGKTAQD